MRKPKFAMSAAAIALALSLAIVNSAFTTKTATKFATVRFHFIPANGSEAGYELAGSWQQITDTPDECDEGSDPCVIEIDDSYLTGSGTMEQRLRNYLAAQGVTSTDYPNAAAAVAALTAQTKP